MAAKMLSSFPLMVIIAFALLAGTSSASGDQKRLHDLEETVEIDSKRLALMDNRLSRVEEKLEAVLKKVTADEVKKPRFNTRDLKYKKSPVNGKIYYSNKTPLMFEDAREFCEKSGGSLPKINSDDENVWLTETFVTYWNVWLAAAKSSGGDKWAWLDGSNFTYSNFEVPPQCSYGDCGVMASLPYGKWYGHPFGMECMTVCELNV